MRIIITYTILFCLLFSYSRAADPCSNIQQIQCGDTILFNATGVGDPAYPNGMNGQGCSAGTAQGGQETIYKFIVPVTGTYQMNTTASNNYYYVDYYYKRNNAICNNTGWTCINRAINAGETLGAFSWNAGDTILFLLNAELTGTTIQSFKINCATNLCDAINTVSCGDTILFSSTGFGDPGYANGMNGQGCSIGTAQGGQETIYKFIVPVTGTYQMNTTGSNNYYYVDYYYKRNNAICNNIGWTCINRAINAGETLGAFSWNAGDTILFLLNAELTGTTIQSFKINCATNLCDVIQNINYRDTVRFSSTGFGDPFYPNGMNGQGCSVGTAQGGQESIYRFIVPFTGTYPMKSVESNNYYYVDYYYKRNNAICNNSGWTCINRNISANVSLGSFNWVAGDTILFLLNAELTGTTTQAFTLDTLNVIPVKLISFEGANYGSMNKLSWITEFEINTSYFIVEHSTNGMDFYESGRIKASTNTNTNKNYQYSDLFFNSGSNFYRLKILDIDGKFSYSKVILIKNYNEAEIKIYPNPAKDILNVKLNRKATNDIIVNVTDLQGRLFKKEVINCNSLIDEFKLNIFDLPKGMYILSLKNENINKLFIKE